MKIEDITDNDLKRFCQWYKGFHGCKPVTTTIFSTCLTGFFHTHSKAADKLLLRLNRLSLVAMKGTEVFVS